VVKYKHIFAALGMAVLALSLVGCGAFKGQTNDLKSITLTAVSINGSTPGSQTGIYNLEGDGGTIQLAATGVYSGGTSKDITSKVTFSVIVDPNYNQAYLHGTNTTLLPPCQAPNCPAGTAPNFTSGTVEYSSTGLITAVEPAVCTWVQQGTGWFFEGAYQVTVSFDGVTSQPVYIPVASEAGPWTNGACGPTPIG
jgi:hypothetical protein